MPQSPDELRRFLGSVHPYDTLDSDALDVLVPGKRGRVVLDVSARSRPPLRLTRVPLDQADAFLRALRGQG